MADIIDMAEARAQRDLDNALRAQRERAHRAQGPGNPGGVCPDCGDAIPAERLAVVPHAVRCADCQGAIEQLEGRP